MCINIKHGINHSIKHLPSGWVRIPTWLKRLFPHLVWDIPGTEKIVYITFDDGPTENVTHHVLHILDTYGAKATFFCLGRNVEKHPEIFEKIKAAGHTVGSHGFDHLNGLVTPVQPYLENAKKGIRMVNSGLFRPPFGKITPRQIKMIKPIAQIVIWSILSMDYDSHISSTTCLNRIIQTIYPGAIIVFHDTEQAASTMYDVLPKLLDYLYQHGYKAMPIPLKLMYP